MFTVSIKVDVLDYCKVHQAAMIPDPTNCAKFYNCSQNMATKTAVTSECKYPDLFSRVSNKCERFQNVSCDTRKEPQAPCKFDLNIFTYCVDCCVTLYIVVFVLMQDLEKFL